jgi:L-ribulokinase
MHADHLLMGLDFGTDTVRAVAFDADTGMALGSGVQDYRRWRAGRWCEPQQRQFRQHPDDHREAMLAAVQQAVQAIGPEAAARVRAIAVDATGSSPMPLDAQGRPLADDPTFAEDPDALCILWKDQTATAEAARITALGAYTRYCGGCYSPEWFWAKVAHIAGANARVRDAAATWVEHVDWLGWMLCGGGDPTSIPRNRCAAGHKALWHDDWQGWPAAADLARIDPSLAAVRDSLRGPCVLPGTMIGRLADDWGQHLGLPAGIPVAAGALDGHLGAVGAGVAPGRLVLVLGTSSCVMAVAESTRLAGVVPGISGQVDGSMLPGLIGLEAGQSAFGDIYAWFERLLVWSRADHAGLLTSLDAAAAERRPCASGITALDFFNGRRTPDPEPAARGALTGLHLGHDAVDCYRALVEASAFGVRAIVDRLTAHGVPVDEVVAVGGIAQKSGLVMQTCADALDRPLLVAASEQGCALGAAMLAACAADLHPDLASAQAAMRGGISRRYQPRPDARAAMAAGYQRYRHLATVAAIPSGDEE